MQISDEKLKEFKELYFKHFCVELSDQLALEYAIKLVSFVKIGMSEYNDDK
jgi:hypothetical protein